MPDLRWAARFAFVDELWRGRPRIVVDRGLEAWLRGGESPAGSLAEPAPVAALVDALLPLTPGGPDVWMVVQTPAVAGRLGNSRAGTRFVVRDALPNLLARAPWQTLLLDLRALAHDPRDLPLALERSGVDAIETRRGRVCVYANEIADDDGETYEILADVLARAGGGRVYSLYAPAMTGVVELAGTDEDEDAADEVIEDAEGGGESPDESLLSAGIDDGEVVERPGDHAADEALPNVDANETEDVESETEDVVEEEGAAEDDDGAEAEDDGEDPAEDVPLFYDNTLGLQDPEPFAYLGIAGDRSLLAGLPEGMSLIELPPGSVLHDDDAKRLHGLIQDLRDELEHTTLERDRQGHRIDALEGVVVAAERELAELRERLASTPVASEPPSSLAELDASPEAEAPSEALPSLDASSEPDRSHGDANEALESALAREQALTWRVRQLEAQLEAALARPVHELEAEVAHLRALLSQRGSTPGSEGPDGPEGGTDPAPAGSEGATSGGAPPAPAENGRSPSWTGRDESPDPPTGGVTFATAVANGTRQDGPFGESVAGGSRPGLPVDATWRLSNAADGGRTTRVVLRMVDGLVRRIERGGIGTLALRKELVALRRRLELDFLHAPSVPE